jgi:hypothetical protein
MQLQHAICIYSLCSNAQPQPTAHSSQQHHSVCPTPFFPHNLPTRLTLLYGPPHLLRQSLLPVPPLEQLPAHLAQLWGATNSFSLRFWPTLCSVRALSNCSLVVLDADKFAELLTEYDWVRSHRCSLNLVLMYCVLVWCWTRTSLQSCSQITTG